MLTAMTMVITTICTTLCLLGHTVIGTSIGRCDTCTLTCRMHTTRTSIELAGSLLAAADGVVWVVERPT